MEFHQLTHKEAGRRLETDLKKGLSQQEALARLERHGRNQIKEKKRQGILLRFLGQFKDAMILILLAAAGVSFGVSLFQGNQEYIDSIIILVIVVCNALIGTIQEVKADRAIEALKELTAPHATVLREGKKEIIDAAAVVPGDIVLLKTGDLVPADLRLIQSVSLKAEESALTGESVPSEKDASVCCEEKAVLGERHNMLFAGCGVAAGSGVGVVTATGMDTAMGKIAKMLDNEEAPATPLQEKLKQFSKVLGLVVLLICGVIFVLGLIQKINPIEMFMIAISLAVAAIPEGMAAVVTIVLAIGVKRMAQKKAIIRHMPAVETLGSTEIICSDKTGTLTQNRMTVTNVVSLKGDCDINGAEAQWILSLCSLCNNSEQIGRTLTGDPTETAFVRACRTAKPVLEEQYPRVGEIPFSSKRKRMSTAHKIQGGYRIITKGAPDVLLPLCTQYRQGDHALDLTQGIKAKIMAENEKLANGALRVLAVAYKEVSGLSKDDRETEEHLIFCGLVAMEDPPRKGVKQAVQICKKAGIRPVMITGDHATTALAIARRLSIIEGKGKVMTGAQLETLSDEALSQVIFDYQVFARVSPEHKVKLVKAFQKHQKVVAMTGDGVNDAPALKAADIGCAMGKNGTEVAKSAADMILTDDDFSTVVSAVREGRGIYKNIRKTIHFLVSCNIGEILLIFAAFLLNLPTPLIAIQLLWVNLVTDSLPALALGADPIEPRIMEERPHKKTEGIFAGGLGLTVALEGCLIGALALLAYTIGRSCFDLDPGNPVIGRSMSFAVLSLSQLVHSFNMRSERSVFEVGLFSNRKLLGAALICGLLMVSVITVPFLTEIFKTTTLNLLQWLMVFLLSVIPLFVVEMEKLWQGRKPYGTAGLRTRKSGKTAVGENVKNKTN